MLCPAKIAQYAIITAAYAMGYLKGNVGAGKPQRGHSCKGSWKLVMAGFSVPLP